MPLGPFFFAWTDATETTFAPAHARVDETIFAFELSQEEGDFASLRLDVRNPRVGLLAPGRKTWGWFSWDRAFNAGGPADVVPLFFGRLIGIPTNVFGEIVSLEFIARPADYVARKATAAAALRVLPWYDPVWIAADKRSDDDTVLEARAALWHCDRVTHAVTASSITAGEDGTENFPASDLLNQGLDLKLNNVPLRSVHVDGKVSWAQTVTRDLDLSAYIRSRFAAVTGEPVITSFTFDGLVQGWPQPGAGIGEGWTVTVGSCVLTDNLTVRSSSYDTGKPLTGKDPSATETINGQISGSDDTMAIPAGSVAYMQVHTEGSYHESRDDEGQLQSVSQTGQGSDVVAPLGHLAAQLQVRAQPNSRRQTELVSFDLAAEVQPIVTLPGEDELLSIAVDSVDVGIPIDGEIPVGQPWRRSYIATDRGLRSLEYLILMARARLLMAARAVEISEAVPFARLPDLSLRKSATVNDPRLPAGSATGKLIAYRAALDGNTGKATCSVTLGCSIGQGGAINPVAGNPVWAEAAYVGADYQVFAGGTNIVVGDVGYTPPVPAPNDDGLNFDADLTPTNALETPLTISNPPNMQRALLIEVAESTGLAAAASPGNGNQPIVDAAVAQMTGTLSANPTAIRFGLKPLNREFTTEYPIAVSMLKIPQTIDLQYSP